MNKSVIIIGGGIAGASAAYFLSEYVPVVLLEAEEFLGTRSSGRSSEQFTIGIAAETMRRMGEASRKFFTDPPSGFCDDPLVSPRGCLTVGRLDQKEKLDRLYKRITSVGALAKYVNKEETKALFPMLRDENFDIGVYEVDAMDIDANLLMQSYAKGAKARGANVVTRAKVCRIERKSDVWEVETESDTFTSDRLVNAAGAWVDEIANLAGIAPVGITPRRRSAFTFNRPEGLDVSGWPHVTSLDYQWYVQPARDCLVGSLAEAVAVPPGEVYPEDLDIAQAVYNIEQATRFEISKPLSTWAGLRSFVGDKSPVCGTRPGDHGFFWLAGQGGCGILTSPAMGSAMAALMLGVELPAEHRDLGITPHDLSPCRASISSSKS